jgi:hypothetical protein
MNRKSMIIVLPLAILSELGAELTQRNSGRASTGASSALAAASSLGGRAGKRNRVGCLCRIGTDAGT